MYRKCEPRKRLNGATANVDWGLRNVLWEKQTKIEFRKLKISKDGQEAEFSMNFLSRNE